MPGSKVEYAEQGYYQQPCCYPTLKGRFGCVHLSIIPRFTETA